MGVFQLEIFESNPVMVHLRVLHEGAAPQVFGLRVGYKSVWFSQFHKTLSRKNSSQMQDTLSSRLTLEGLQRIEKCEKFH